MSNASGRRGGEDRIPFFTGKPGDNFKRWMDRFMMGARAMQWNDATKLAQIPTYFTEIAESRWYRIDKRIVDAFTLKEVPDENDIVVYLSKMFEDKGERDRNAKKLFDVRQGKVSVVEYMNELEETALKAYPDDPISAGLKKNIFMRGLNADLRTKVEYKNPSSIEEMLEEAKRFEALRMHENSSKNEEKLEINTASRHVKNNQEKQKGQGSIRRRWYNQREKANYTGPRQDPRREENRNYAPNAHRPNTKKNGEPRSVLLRETVRDYAVPKKYLNAEMETFMDYDERIGVRKRQDESAIHRVSTDLSNCKEIGGPVCVAKITMEGIKTIALIDTGATVSVISESLDQKLPLAIKREMPAGSANSVSGHQLQFTKACLVEIVMGQEKISHKMQVLKKLPYPCILGTDIIEKIGVMSVDFKNGTMSLGNEAVLELVPHEEVVRSRKSQKVRDDSSTQINLVAHKTQILEPWSQNCVWVCAEDVENGTNLLTDNLSVAKKLVEGGLLLARSLGTVKEGKIPVTILNTSLNAYQLYANASIGRADTLAAEEMNFIGHISHAPIPNALKNPLEHLDLSQSDLSKSEKEKMIQFIRDHSSVFSSGTENPGQTHRVTHKINTGDSSPLHVRAHRTPFSKRETVKKMVKDMVDAGIARPSCSPWSSPIVLAKKKSGEDRFCVDYRRLNDITKKDTYPLPKISELLDSLGKSKFFSTLDLAKGYWQIPMNEEDREKTAFITPEGRGGQPFMASGPHVRPLDMSRGPHPQER